jgi:hypothetical protein
MHRYKVALQEFAERFEGATENWQEDLEWLKSHALVVEKHASDTQDKQAIHFIEQSLDENA